MDPDGELPANKYGTPIKHDPNFNGPRSKRGCTDVIFLILFVCFLGAWGYVAFYGFTKGDPQRFLRATDSNGRKCGVDSEVLDKPYLFFFDLTACANPKTLLNGCDTPQVCVKECPSESWSSLPYRNNIQRFDARSIQSSLVCVDDRVKSTVTTVQRLTEVINNRQCADWYISSRPLYGRCLNLVGSLTQLNRPNLNDGLSSYQLMLSGWIKNRSDSDQYIEVMGKVIDDLYKSWRSIVVVLVITILVSLLYITLLRWIAGIMTWLSLIALLALLITLSLFCYKRFDYLKKNGPDEVNSSMIQGQLEELGNNETLFLVLTIVFGVIAAILFLLVVFLRGRIQIAITLIKEGSKAVSNVISSLFFPIIPWCLQALIMCWFIIVLVSLGSVGEQVFKARFLQTADCRCTGAYLDLKSADVCSPQLFSELCKSSTNGPCRDAGCHFSRIDSPSIVTYFHIFNAFGLFWAVWFVMGLSDMILAGTFAKWYWTMDKRKVPFFTVTGSAGTAIRYHLGTVAFGSLIIAICSFIRACIEYLEKKTKAYDNSIIKALFCCLKCFFWCLENFLRFINKNAYIMCAIHGRNFCTSAKDAFNLLMRNILRVVVLDKVTDFLFFIGKLVITGGIVFGAHFLFFTPNRLKLNYDSTVPLVVIAVGAYIIASIFFGVYSMAVDTLFLCFLEDCERNDGSVEKPYFMSVNLMKILGKKNRKDKKVK
ncbi:Plasma-membrane choline transporter [Nesidiocoris tenuis]|uniref:Choline transporter-like protein n=1 Tax=Nesidiocoris tenuis TaxID=355587 RepID=A0ABN7B9W9_9HEMI|nr:Plasma-membrane choline transporter [Nesidiocoris tenuis]